MELKNNTAAQLKMNWQQYWLETCKFCYLKIIEVLLSWKHFYVNYPWNLLQF